MLSPGRSTLRAATVAALVLALAAADLQAQRASGSVPAPAGAGPGGQRAPATSADTARAAAAGRFGSAPGTPAGQRPASPCSTAVTLVMPPLGEPLGSLARVAELAGAARLRGRLINDPWSDLSLSLCDTVPGPLRRLVRRVPAPSAGPTVDLLPLTNYDDFNSAYPRDRDNGAMWAGRGLSSALYGGLSGQWGALSAAIFPGVIFQQNASFAIDTAKHPGYSSYILPGFGQWIDLPQRFGSSSYTTFDPGESYVRVDAFHLQAGVSTENLRWGPAVRNPIMLTYNAPGFLHAFAGTGAPLDIGIGHVEAKVIWGRLTASNYFRTDSAAKHRLLAGWIGQYEPRWLPGLFLGATLMYETYPPPGGFGPTDYIKALLNRPIAVGSENRPGNGLAALYGRWAFPASGFEAYAEWARDDYSASAQSLLMEPDHSQTYTLGIQKVVPTGAHWVRILGELTHLEAASTLRGGRGVVEMYTHQTVLEGHTQEGQLLGAAIGPGSDAQFLGLDVFTGPGSTGGYIERVRYNDDAYYQTYARFYGNSAHDVELTGGFRQSVYWGNLTLRSELTLSYRIDRSFLGLDGTNWNLRKDDNLGLRLGAAWAPRTRLLAGAAGAP